LSQVTPSQSSGAGTDRYAPRKAPHGAVLLGAGLLVGLGVGFLILAGLGFMGRLPNLFGSGRAAAVLPSVDEPALDFTLANLDGTSLSLDDLRGKNVLINFWATWCGPCRQEMPMLEAAYQAHASDLVVLAVNIGEEPWRVKKFVHDLGLSFEVLMDEDNQVQSLYRVRAYPTTYLVDTQGVVRAQHIGLLSEAQLEKYLERVDWP
jgi:cytochrome c biogenesis protein CcmG/thiol:disulfide interchange protein DsbE